MFFTKGGSFMGKTVEVNAPLESNESLASKLSGMINDSNKGNSVLAGDIIDLGVEISEDKRNAKVSRFRRIVKNWKSKWKKLSGASGEDDEKKAFIASMVEDAKSYQKTIKKQENGQASLSGQSVDEVVTKDMLKIEKEKDNCTKFKEKWIKNIKNKLKEQKEKVNDAYDCYEKISKQEEKDMIDFIAENIGSKESKNVSNWYPFYLKKCKGNSDLAKITHRDNKVEFLKKLSGEVKASNYSKYIPMNGEILVSDTTDVSAEDIENIKDLIDEGYKLSKSSSNRSSYFSKFKSAMTKYHKEIKKISDLKNENEKIKKFGNLIASITKFVDSRELTYSAEDEQGQNSAKVEIDDDIVKVIQQYIKIRKFLPENKFENWLKEENDLLSKDLNNDQGSFKQYMDHVPGIFSDDDIAISNSASINEDEKKILKKFEMFCIKNEVYVALIEMLKFLDTFNKSTFDIGLTILMFSPFYCFLNVKTIRNYLFKSLLFLSPETRKKIDQEIRLSKNENIQCSNFFDAYVNELDLELSKLKVSLTRERKREINKLKASYMDYVAGKKNICSGNVELKEMSENGKQK